MTDAILTDEIAGLRETYGEVAVATASDGQRLVRIADVVLPRGCLPSSTPVLLMMHSGQPRPQIFVKPGIRVANGGAPRSTSVIQVEGEAWLQFSYAFPWDENTHSLVQFVAAALRRFAIPE